MATRTTPTDTAEPGLRHLAPEQETVFFGFLQAHMDITRALEHQLTAAHGMSLAGYEVLNRLSGAADDGLRMTDLADRSRLSLSRISRVVDDLQLRGMVERRACATDKRVSYAALTEAGAAFLREAQETFYDVVEDRFLGRLSARETRVLADVFGRMVGGDTECRSALGESPA